MIRRRRLLLIPASLIVLTACVWYWLLHTESGAQWLWARAQSATGDALQAQSLRGDLGSGLTIRRFGFATDSITFEIDEIRLSADLDILPLQIQISDVSIRDAGVQGTGADRAAVKNDLRDSIEKLSLPLLLDFADVSVDKLSLSEIIPGTDIVLTQATLAGSWHDEIIVEHLLADSFDSSIDLSAELELIRPFAATVSAKITNADVLAELLEPIDIHLRGDGDLEELSIDISSSPIAMSIQGSLSEILDSMTWNLQATLEELTLQLGENKTEVRVADGHASGSGSLQEYLLTAAATVDLPDFEPLQVTTSGKGTKTSFDFSDLGLHNDGADLNGVGRIVWGENWSIESRLSVAAFNLHALVDMWPVDHSVHGNLSVQLDRNHLLIRNSHLSAGNTGMSVQAGGNVDFLASVIDGNLRWENALWPLVGDQPSVLSNSGDISVDGSLDDWRIEGKVELATAAMPSGQFLIDGSGDRHHVETTIIDSTVLGGEVSGYAAFSWRDQQPWSAGLNMSGIDLSSFAEDWPDDVTGRVDAKGQTSPFALGLQLSNIDAVFRGGALSANGEFTLGDDHFTASKLKLLHGKTRIELDGDPFARAGLNFDVQLHDASQYIDDASGAFAGTGKVSLHPEQPKLRIDASSDAFSFGDIDVTGIEITDLSDDGRVINAQLRAEAVNIQGEVFENISATLFATNAEQNLRLSVSYGDADAHLFAAGNLNDLQRPRNWQGELKELRLEVNEEPLAELSEPIELSLSNNAVTLDRGCIAADAGARLCVESDWSANSYFNFGAALVDVPVNLVNRFFDTNLQFDQLLNGNIDWSQHAETGTTGSAEIMMSAGTVIDVDHPDISIKTDVGILSFDAIDGQLLSGTADLSMPGFGHIDAQMSIPDLAEGSNSSVNGLLDLDLSNMAVLAAFLPVIDAASGEIRVDLSLSGTLSEPKVVGDLALVNGSMTYLPIGLQLDEINVSSLLHDSGQFELSGEFRAGDGRGEIITRADYATTSAKGFELELRGSNMTLIDVPNISARADLDVRVAYDYKKLLLDGQILIPHARVEPTNLPVSPDTESDDVIIVAGELPGDVQRQARKDGAWIEGSIGVEFGDDVVIDLGPATANLTGNTVFSWEENVVPIADGQYDLRGSIQAFGQLLEITEGGLRFPKIPADNPFVRIRAEREIYGNAQVKTAGVLVDGTLRQPVISAYTKPLTTEERALTLLVTGSDFDFEQGVGAIDFGTYIAPKLFVSYGVGLFETENVIRIRYDLKRGFGITATSGEKETGLDLSYRVER